jgi:hypothetical protein
MKALQAQRDKRRGVPRRRACTDQVGPRGVLVGFSCWRLVFCFDEFQARFF